MTLRNREGNLQKEERERKELLVPHGSAGNEKEREGDGRRRWEIEKGFQIRFG